MTPDDLRSVSPGHAAAVDLLLAGIPTQHRRRRPAPAVPSEVATEPESIPRPEPDDAVPAPRLAPYLDRGVLTVPPPPLPAGGPR